MLIHELITATQAERDREVRAIMHRRLHLANVCLPRSRGLVTRLLAAVRRGQGASTSTVPAPRAVHPDRRAA